MRFLPCIISHQRKTDMRGSRKFCQRGSKFDNVFFLRFRKQAIIAFYFEFETVLKFNNLEA